MILCHAVLALSKPVTSPTSSSLSTERPSARAQQHVSQVPTAASMLNRQYKVNGIFSIVMHVSQSYHHHDHLQQHPLHCHYQIGRAFLCGIDAAAHLSNTIRKSEWLNLETKLSHLVHQHRFLRCLIRCRSQTSHAL